VKHNQTPQTAETNSKFLQINAQNSSKEWAVKFFVYTAQINMLHQ